MRIWGKKVGIWGGIMEIGGGITSGVRLRNLGWH